MKDASDSKQASLVQAIASRRVAKGGSKPSSPADEVEEDRPASIAAAIRRKRQMADGGLVADKKEDYDETDDLLLMDAPEPEADAPTREGRLAAIMKRRRS